MVRGARRLNLVKAVEGDDWSAVIDGQTSETVQPPAEEAASPPTPPGQLESPFSRVNVHRSIGELSRLRIRRDTVLFESRFIGQLSHLRMLMNTVLFESYSLQVARSGLIDCMIS